MPKKSIDELAAIFATGKRPTAQDFKDIFDSFVHKDDVEEINEMALNEALQDYDEDLKNESADGAVNTLGDVFKVFQGYSDARKINDELKWSGIPDRPASINLAWTEQTINFTNYSAHFSTFNDATDAGEVFEVKFRTMNGLRIAALGTDDGKKINIVDIIVIRRKLSTTLAAIHEIRGVVVGITPKVNLV